MEMSVARAIVETTYPPLPNKKPGGWTHYYQPWPGLGLKEIIFRWRYLNEQPREGVVYWVPVADLWDRREYTWTRDDARRTPAEWDELILSMQGGWKGSDPLLLWIGQKGGVKVGEGNHRLAIARMLRLRKVPVRLVFVKSMVTKQIQLTPEEQAAAAVTAKRVKAERDAAEIAQAKDVEARRAAMTPEQRANLDDMVDQIMGFL